MAARQSLLAIVRPAPGKRTEGRLIGPHGVVRAALGRTGIAATRREGDGSTPFGRLPLREVLYRADRGKRPRTKLPVRAIRDRDSWCDDPGEANYNRLVTLPAARRAEGLWRTDRLYDVVIVLGYNDRPRVKGRGSAIFVHLARPGYTPTQGCIALSRRDIVRLLAHARRGSAILVTR